MVFEISDNPDLMVGDILTVNIEGGEEIMKIDRHGVISFPQGLPADDTAKAVIKILKESIVILDCVKCRDTGHNE